MLKSLDFADVDFFVYVDDEREYILEVEAMISRYMKEYEEYVKKEIEKMQTMLQKLNDIKW
jgi:hypothetical protein